MMIVMNCLVTSFTKTGALTDFFPAGCTPGGSHYHQFQIKHEQDTLHKK